jgi:hypothetical protein
MANYSVKFVNDKSTKQTWTMAIYQTIPNMGVFDNVAWKQVSVPSSGTRSVDWTLLYNSAMADFFSAGDIGVYELIQILNSDLGRSWQVVNSDGVQQLKPLGTAPAGYIFITNNSGIKANAGIGIDNVGSIYQRNLSSGSTAQFMVTPRYYASIFNNVVPGQVISTASPATDPVEVIFRGGLTSVTLTAFVEGETLFFGDKSAESGSLVATPMALVNERLRLQGEAHQLLLNAHPRLLGPAGE